MDLRSAGAVLRALLASIIFKNDPCGQQKRKEKLGNILHTYYIIYYFGNI
jgi:hypothetical protein